jgi:hypothetical protein
MSSNVWATIFQVKLINFDKKMGWATSWAIFPQTNLATLALDCIQALLA